jgi:hypothetical protein
MGRAGIPPGPSGWPVPADAPAPVLPSMLEGIRSQIAAELARRCAADLIRSQADAARRVFGVAPEDIAGILESVASEFRPTTFSESTHDPLRQ